jgi:plasmid stabilization system protein ParE
MNTQEFFFTESAKEAFHNIILQVQQVSLIAAERVRSKIFHKIHLIHHHPLQSSKPIDLNGMEGHIRLTTVMNYKIYYLVEDERIIVLDLLMDKELQQEKG